MPGGHPGVGEHVRYGGVRLDQLHAQHIATGGEIAHVDLDIEKLQEEEVHVPGICIHQGKRLLINIRKPQRIKQKTKTRQKTNNKRRISNKQKIKQQPNNRLIRRVTQRIHRKRKNPVEIRRRKNSVESL